MISPLALTTYNFKLKKYKNKIYLWDTIRNKYIKLTPEEWVRQNFIRFLIEHRGYNKNLISIERGFINNNLLKRYDILIYKNNEAKLLVECKNYKINLSNDILHQVQLYNYKLKVPFVIITNGIKYSSFKLKYDKTTSYKILNYIPHYNEI